MLLTQTPTAMTRYQGEDIEFTLTLKPQGDTDIRTWSECDKVVVYLYTPDTGHISKFATNGGEGYNTLTPVNAETLGGVIPTADTINMKGCVVCDVYLRTTGRELDLIHRARTCIVIESTKIKAEAEL